MKAVLQNMKDGTLQVGDVPPPSLRPGGVLVAVRNSLISLGTERAILALAKKSPVGKARDRPDLARKVINKAKQEGLWSTYQVVRNLLDSPIPLGYSCAGEVIAAGREAGDFQVGQLVACAGLNYANHAEIDYVPRNLAVPLPEGLSCDAASFMTVGAIAMQGVRLAEPQLGETIVVLGLGLVGQLTAQIARCAGATVIAADVDPTKLELARTLGAHHVMMSDGELAAVVRSMTGGHGADAVLVCAATKSNQVIQLAASASRLKGRVVVVGDVGLQLERRPFFEKEINLVVSRSYGPGRYDPAYENRGVDYPLPYVRWTEGRNMSSFLELLARDEVRVDPLITHRFAIEDAEQAYEIVSGKRQEPAIAILLDYGEKKEHATRVPLRAAGSSSRDEIRLGVIGAGQFAKGVLLPAFAKHNAVKLDAFCTSSGLTSRHIAERYGSRYCTGDAAEILDDPQIDGVIIATRHDQHAALTTEALRRGKAVFVEKPLALTEDALADLDAVLRETEAPRLMVGFNRRFAPLAIRCKEEFSGRHAPLFVMCRINAGVVPEDSWVLDPVEGGGRILGEVCHFVDTLAFLCGSLPARIHAERAGAAMASPDGSEGVSINLRMRDGSLGVVHYLGNGDPSVPKEYLELFCGERTAILDNYRSLSVHHNNRRRRKRLLNQAKGHAEEVAAFVEALRSGDPMPIDPETLISVTQTTFLIHRSLETGGPVEYTPPRAVRDSAS